VEYSTLIFFKPARYVISLFDNIYYINGRRLSVTEVRVIWAP